MANGPRLKVPILGSPAKENGPQRPWNHQFCRARTLLKLQGGEASGALEPIEKESSREAHEIRLPSERTPGRPMGSLHARRFA